MISSDLQSEAKNLRISVFKLHLKHKSLASELQSQRDTDAKNKATLKHLEGILFWHPQVIALCFAGINELHYIGVQSQRHTSQSIFHGVSFKI